MPILILITFVLLVALLVYVLNAKKNKAKKRAVFEYGQNEFSIELPASASLVTHISKVKRLSILDLSNPEAFFLLVSPYLGSLSVTKRDFLYQAINDLKDELKMNKHVYQIFVEEYKKYDGLSEEAAAEKWTNPS